MLDVAPRSRKNVVMATASASRTRLAKALETAFTEGLISQETFHLRMDAVLGPSLIRPHDVIGDLTFRGRSFRGRMPAAITTVLDRLGDLFGQTAGISWTLLALDWTGPDQDLIVGRHHACDVRLADSNVSRRHARLKLRDGRWILQDLASTNGTTVNGVRVGRCELRPGDRIVIGAEHLRVD
jgi:hypothetical protein